MRLFKFSPLGMAAALTIFVSAVFPQDSTARTRRRPAFDADKALAQARDLARSGDSANSEAIVDRVLRADRRNVDAHLQKGTLLLRRGEVDAAEQSYRQVLGRAPKYTDAYLGLSNVELRRRQPANAQFWLDQIPQDAVLSPEVDAQRGRVARSQGKFWKARNWFDKAIAAEPGNLDYTEARADTPLFINTLSVESEKFERSGTVTNVNNTLSFKPDRRFAVDVIGEKWFRSRGEDAERFGAGVTVSPFEELSLHGQFLESTDRESLPSRYDVDADLRVLPDPGTHVLAGYTRFASDPLNTDVYNLGVKQYLSEKFALQFNHYWAKDDGRNAEEGRSQVAKLIYEDPRVRTLALGVATGNETFRVDSVGIQPGGSYDFDSVFVTAKQWFGKNWGLLAGAAINQRSNDNDSHILSGGVFVEF